MKKRQSELVVELFNGRREGEEKRRESNLLIQVMVLEDMCQFLCEVLTQKERDKHIHQKILKYRDHKPYGSRSLK